MLARYNYRLRVSDTQAADLQQVFDSCRFVWNNCLGRWGDLWRHEGLSLFSSEMDRELTDWRSKFEWLEACPSVPQQQVIGDLGQAISNFFDKKKLAGRPRFKKKSAGYATARWTRRGFGLVDGRLEVATMTKGQRASLRVVWSRPLPSQPKMVTVFRDSAGRWWASFVVEVEAEELDPSGRTTGLDVGLTTYATTEYSDFDVPNPRFARNAAKALARSQRNLARKKKGSRNRAKAKQATARVHAKVREQRDDFNHKQARHLARSFDRIGVEDLRIRNMLRNRSLARSISDAGWGQFLRTLEWQASKVNREVIKLDPRNTTQNCSQCGTKAKSHLGLADRLFSCSECGLVLDRDRNAARNLNPNRQVKTGEGVEGAKTRVPVGTRAA